jgi:hypothetical protein
MTPELWWSELGRRKTKVTPINWEEIKKDEDSFISGDADDELNCEKNDIEEYRDCGSINHGDALSDGNIWWFRD